MQRHSITLHSSADILGAPTVALTLAARLAAARTFTIGPDGYLSLRCVIDDGAGGAPTDAPVGFWELYSSDDGVGFSLVSSAAYQLARIRPNGSAKVEGFAIIEGVPGTVCKLAYLRSSGGGGNSRVTLTGSVNRP